MDHHSILMKIPSTYYPNHLVITQVKLLNLVVNRVGRRVMHRIVQAHPKITTAIDRVENQVVIVTGKGVEVVLRNQNSAILHHQNRAHMIHFNHLILNYLGDITLQEQLENRVVVNLEMIL